jgi:hypothetical protein
LDVLGSRDGNVSIDAFHGDFWLRVRKEESVLVGIVYDKKTIICKVRIRTNLGVQHSLLLV